MFAEFVPKTKQSVGSDLPAHLRSPAAVAVLVDVLELVGMRVVVVVVVVSVVIVVVVAVVELVEVLELVDVLVLDEVAVVRVEVVGLQVPHRTGQSACIRSRMGAILLVHKCVKSALVG
jgi:hypothetical protein